MPRLDIFLSIICLNSADARLRAKDIKRLVMEVEGLTMTSTSAEILPEGSIEHGPETVDP